jgi:hypothetical protein
MSKCPCPQRVERNDLRLAGLPRTDRLVDHRPDGVVRLRGRHDPLYAAARNRDLTFAQQAGLGTAFIPRPSEFGTGQTQDLTAEGDWDLVCDSILDLSRRFADA